MDITIVKHEASDYLFIFEVFSGGALGKSEHPQMKHSTHRPHPGLLWGYHRYSSGATTAIPGSSGRRRRWMKYFRTQLVSRQRKRIDAACGDMWEPFRLSIAHPQCKIVYDKFHILQHANDAIRRSAEGGALPARAQEAGAHQREEMVAAESDGYRGGNAQ